MVSNTVFIAIGILHINLEKTKCNKSTPPLNHTKHTLTHHLPQNHCRYTVTKSIQSVQVSDL